VARRRLAVIVVSLAVQLAGSVAPVQARPDSRAPNGSWIVTLKEGADPQASSVALTKQHGGAVEHVFGHALRGFSFRGPAAAAQAIARSPSVASVVADRELRAVAETLPWGIKRIDAHHQTAPDAHEAGFNGAGVSIAILDTGVDLDHQDLNVDVARSRNCMGVGPPEDGHGHGTHVAGTAAAVGGNGQGVVGVAPDAVIVAVKVLDDSGVGSDATVICGVDYLTQLATDGDPANDIAVANMSLGEEGSAGHCADGGLRQAICESVASGVTYVVAAETRRSTRATSCPLHIRK
jgi:subtilisin